MKFDSIPPEEYLQAVKDGLIDNLAKHGGPGPHSNGTPQAVHGGEGDRYEPFQLTGEDTRVAYERARKWGREFFMAFEPFPSDELHAMDAWTHLPLLNTAMSAVLRGEELDDVKMVGEAKKQIKILKNCLDQCETPENIVAYRGLSTEDPDENMIAMDNPKYPSLKDRHDRQERVINSIWEAEIGSTFVEPSFSATSVMTSGPKDFSKYYDHVSGNSETQFMQPQVIKDDLEKPAIFMRIRVPKGSKAMYMYNSEFESYEAELLLQAGTTFRIDKKFYGEEYPYDDIKGLDRRFRVKYVEVTALTP